MTTRDEEDYGDYVTRCICGLTHDDGYMIQCDGCSVWQHVECMQVNPNNLPDKYLCEICGPRPVDRRRARQLQLKKREDLSGDEDGSPDEGRVRVSSHLPPSGATPGGLAVKKKKKRGSKSGEAPKPEVVVGKRPKREKVGEGPPKKTRRKSQQLPRVQHMGQPAGRGGSIQSLLTAASLLEEQPWTDVWNSNSSPWTDKYELAERNRYTETVRSLLASRLSQLKSEAVVYSQEEYCTLESRMPHPQCSLGEVQQRRKGVVADLGIGGDELVIEYKGKVTVKQAVLNDLAVGKSLWKHKPCPFVYLYDKISEFDLCIDARSYGNLARFIRRSCTPNAELRHFFVASELCFGVYATDDITTGEEVTLPFDFRYEKCDYPVECACGQKSTCLVVRSNRSKKRHSGGGGGGGTKSVEEGESRQSRGSSRTRSHVLAHDEDSNSSWVSSGSGRKKPRHGAGPFSPRQSSRQTSREMSSESEEETMEKKVKSREERKTEAVWKMFEKMEASQRRRQQLYSEGSVDSDTMSPSTVHPPSLLAHKQQKERHPSTSSRKSQLHVASSGKVRLSSVSSADPLSPTEFSEAFSPPLTPRPSAHPPSAPFAAPSVPPSPLTSPPSSATKAPFLITPHLHPKYLFARFALPWKKAILKQWEEEQRQWGDTPLHLWPSNGHVDPVWSLHVTRGDERRSRARGSLKHRWLKQHSEEVAKGVVEEGEREGSGAGCTGSGSDKENSVEQPRKAPLPHKKQVLLRWKESKGEPVFPQASDAHQSPLPQAEPTTKGSQVASDAPRTPTSPDVPALSSRCTFQLFDEFSSDDEEFELPSRERKGERGAKPEIAGGNEEVKEDPEEGPRTPPESPGTPPLAEELDEEANDDAASNLSTISDTSLHSDTPMVNQDVTKSTNPVTDESSAPPLPPPPLPVLPTQVSVGVSDISESSEDIDVQVEKDHKVPPEPPQEEGRLSDSDGSAVKPRHPGVPWSKSQSEESSEEVEMEVSSPAGVSDERGGNEEEEGVVHWMQGELPREPTMEAEQKGNIQEAQPGEGEPEIREALRTHPGTLREHQLVREQSSGSCSPDPRALPAPPTPGTTGGTARTPGKRKINLSEYRNRARKPAEQRKSSATSSPPHAGSAPAAMTSSTPAFLSHVIAPSLLTSASPLHTSTFVHTPFTHSHTFTTPGGMLEPGVMGVPPPAPPPPVGAAAAPQFEPVSPDDGDNTPPMVIMEGSNPGHQGQLHVVPAGVTTMLVPNLPGYPPGTVATHGGIISAEQLMVGQLPVSYMQQAPPPATGQYVIDVRWSGGAPVEHAHDPRRGAIQGSGEMYAQQPVHIHPQDQMSGHHGGLLPLPGTPTGPPPMVIQHPGPVLQLPLHTQPGPGDIQPHPQGLIHHPPGEYRPPPHPPAPGPRPTLGFVPHHHRQVYRPRHPDSSGGYYGH